MTLRRGNVEGLTGEASHHLSVGPVSVLNVQPPVRPDRIELA